MSPVGFRTLPDLPFQDAPSFSYERSMVPPRRRLLSRIQIRSRIYMYRCSTLQFENGIMPYFSSSQIGSSGRSGGYKNNLATHLRTAVRRHMEVHIFFRSSLFRKQALSRAAYSSHHDNRVPAGISNCTQHLTVGSLPLACPEPSPCAKQPARSSSYSLKGNADQSDSRNRNTI